jgi:hypothetical protein
VRALVGQPLLVSSYPDTRSSSSRSGGVDLATLLITAVASAAAAYACSKIWAPGTLASAAFTPVLVAIIKEALARPTQAVTKAVPIRGVVRSTPPAAQQPGEPPEPPPLERVPRPGEVTYHSTGSSSRRWRLAVITGLLGFVVCVLVFTLPELVAGQSATGGGRSTTLFGGHEHKREQPTQTTTAPARTVTAPTPTVTVPAPAETTTTTTPTTTETAPVEPTVTTPPPTTTAPTVTEPPAVQP